jgi:parallel beta-helix repeat protein
LVYKKYIYREGKKFGPYYFKSVRTEDGKVKSVYLGKEKPLNKFRLLPALLGVLILFSLLGIFSYNGFLTADIVSQNNTEIQEIIGSENISIVNDEINTTKIINKFEVINEDINESEVVNISEGINITINNTQENISIDDTNVTEIKVDEIVSDSNLTNEINLSTNSSLNFEEKYFVKINEPVKKEEIIKFEKSVKNYRLELPTQATNISIVGIKNDQKFKIDKIKENKNLITGGIVFNLEKFSENLLTLFSKIFSFTGMATYSHSDYIVIEESVNELHIEYYLPGPVAIEKNIGSSTKRVEVSSEIDYQNVTVYSYLDGFEEGVYVVDSLGKSIIYDSFDLDEDGKIDYIEWISPTSNENFTISITILNFQSFPVVGRNWTVMFNTTGIADLRITPINGTTWGTVGNENDLMFIDIKCGEESFYSHWETDTIVVSNYSCNETGYESSRVRTSGGHYLEFDFGGQKSYARNSAVCGDVINADNTLTGDLINCSGSYAIAIQNNGKDFTLDCAGFTIDGNRGTTDGIYFQNGNNVTVKNCKIQEVEYGFLSWGNPRNSLIFNNTISASARGIYFYDGDYLYMENNSIIGNTIYNVTSYSGILVVRGYGFNISNNLIYDVDDYGIYNQYGRNHTISNNRIENTTSTAGSGIRMYRGWNYTISKNNITNVNDFGIRVESSNYSTIDSNIIYDSSDDGILPYNGASFNLIKNNEVYGGAAYGIYLYSTHTINNTIVNNSVHDNAAYGIAIGVWNANAGGYNLVANNSIYDNSNNGIFVNTHDTTIYNNDIYNNSANGIYVYRDTANQIFPDKLNISHNRIYQNTQSGLSMVGTNHSVIEYNNNTDNWESAAYGGGANIVSVYNSLFRYNIFSGSGHMGVRLYGNHRNNTWRGNVLANNSILAAYPEMYFCETTPNSGCYNNTWIDTLVDGTNGGFYVLRAEGTKFIDMEVISPGTDVYLSNGGNHTTFLNVTTDNIVLNAPGHNYSVQWYLDVNVSDGTSPLQNMNVSTYDKNNNLEFLGLTDINGRIVRQNITSYRYIPSTFTYYSNYTVNTTDDSGSYLGDYSSVNMTTNKFLNIVLAEANNIPIVNFSRISPTNPNASSDLTGYCNATDGDDDTILYYYEWYNDGVINQTGSAINYSIIEDDTEDAAASTGGPYFRPASYAYDQDWNSAAVVEILNVGTIYINYTKPQNVSNAVIETKYTARFCDETSTLTCYTGSAWAGIASWDGATGATRENVTLPYSCYDNEETIRLKVHLHCSDGLLIGSSASFHEEKIWWNISGDLYADSGIETEVNVLNDTYVSKGQNWTFNCMANDGKINATSWLNTSVLIGNSPPIVQSARIDPSSPYTTEILLGYCNATDIDEDDVTYYYTWYNETELFESGNTQETCYAGHNKGVDGTCTFTLRPNGVGDSETWSDENPSVDHYLNVDDVSPDEDATYIEQVGAFLIFQIGIKENSVSTYSTKSPGISYSDHSFSRTTRPSDSGAWTITDIDNLQIGARETDSGHLDFYDLPASNIPVGSTINKVETFFRAKKWTDKKYSFQHIRATQNWVEVTYTPAIEYYTEGVETTVDTVDDQYTSKHQNWTFNCTAFDGEINASFWENDGVTILNTAPNQVVLSSPADNSTITDRTPFLQWDLPGDDDSDSLTYHLLVDNNIDFSSPILNLSPPGAGVVGTSHTPESDLSLDTLYYWKVRAHDEDDFGIFSNIWNFTVASAVEISATVNGINFGSMGPGTTNNTADDFPPPFILQNDGNCLINVSINATTLFTQAPLDNAGYQFKIDNISAETGSFDWLGSIISWTNMPSAAVVAIDSLAYEDASDSAEIDILVDILGYEDPGIKNASVIFTAELVE